MTREGRPGLKRNQPTDSIDKRTTKKNKVTVDKSPQNGSDWINGKSPVRNAVFKNNRKKRFISSDSDEERPKSPAFHLLNSSPEMEVRARTPTSIIDIDLDLDTFQEPTCLMLPLFHPTIPEHCNWTFWRIYSAELHGMIEKHMEKYKGYKYLSRTMLEELFYQKIHDDCPDYDPIQSQGVRIKKIHGLCQEDNHQTLVMDAVVIQTADNANEAKRKLIACDSLAELLSLVLKDGDFMMIFGHNCLIDGQTIALNSRQQQRNFIAVYRHDAIFTPEKEENSDNLIVPFDYKKFRYLCTENDDDESVLKIEPLHKSILPPGLAPVLELARQETATEKVHRYLDRVPASSDNDFNSSPVSQKKVPSQRNEVDKHTSKSSPGKELNQSSPAKSFKSKGKALLSTSQKSPNKHPTEIRNQDCSSSPASSFSLFVKSYDSDSSSSSNPRRNTSKLPSHNSGSKSSPTKSPKELEQDEENEQGGKMDDNDLLSESSSTDQIITELFEELDKEKQKSKKSPTKSPQSQKSSKTTSSSKRGQNTSPQSQVSKRTSGSKAASPRSSQNEHSENDNLYRNLRPDTQVYFNSSSSEDSDASSEKVIVIPKAISPVNDPPVGMEIEQPESSPENENTRHGNNADLPEVNVVLMRMEDDPALSSWNIRELLENYKAPTVRDYKKEFKLKKLKVILKKVRVPQSTVTTTTQSTLDSSRTRRLNERRDKKGKDAGGKRNLRQRPNCDYRDQL